LEAKRAKPAVYRDYRYRLVRALKILGTDLRVGAVNRDHLETVKNEMAAGTYREPKEPYAWSTIRDSLAAVQTVFRWALMSERVAHDPLKGYEKPSGGQRYRVVTRKEFQALLRASACNRPFQRVLLVLRKTGCRPGELRRLTWDMVDLEQGLWVMPEHKTVKRVKGRPPRMIALPDPILRMCIRLKERSNGVEPHVFLNAWGRPYTKDRLVKCMDRVRKRAGIEVRAGEQIVLYSQRHTYITEGYGKVGDIALAELAGHTDVQTTRRYSHLDVARLHRYQRAVQRARSTRENA
jgi:integrase